MTKYNEDNSSELRQLAEKADFMSTVLSKESVWTCCVGNVIVLASSVWLLASFS